jgi:bacillolysin
VPLMPSARASAADNPRHTCGVSHSLRVHHPLFDYLVDAHSGALVYFYSVTPTADDPVRCTGVDENGKPVEFFGRQEGNAFVMWDPWRHIKTYDWGYTDIMTDGPNAPISGDSAAFANSAAVSAHVNATAVYDFYNSVLLRSSVDGKGLELISNVNCISSDDLSIEKPKQWRNAAWWDKKMWYGQLDEGSTLRSFSRYLDIIAHELTHGVTEATSGLVYREQSGALNESFSDIFGVIIKNWASGRQASVQGWDWEIGSGLGPDGGPLRDMSNPTRTNDPAHMNDYKNYPVTNEDDWGGVHTNSNIHNKVAHTLLTSVGPDGQARIPPKDAAVLYYLCLTRLSSTATFANARAGLVNAANSYYAGSADRAARVDAIAAAYQQVGIG